MSCCRTGHAHRNHTGFWMALAMPTKIQKWLTRQQLLFPILWTQCLAPGHVMAITTILWVFIPAVPTTAAALTAFCSPGRGLRIILLLGDCQSFHQSPLKVFDCSDICDTLDINPVFQIFFWLQVFLTSTLLTGYSL